MDPCEKTYPHHHPEPEMTTAPDPLRFFQSGHLPPRLRLIAQGPEILASLMLLQLACGPERDAGLRKLLEAKDCFIRAAL